MDYNRRPRGDVYPTHGLGPVCLATNIHRGDKMNYLVSLDTKAVNKPAHIREKTGGGVSGFRNGDHTMTMIRTEQGRSILIEHDVSSPRPYSRMFQLSGTRGALPTNIPSADSRWPVRPSIEAAKDHENLNAHSFAKKRCSMP